MKFRDRLAAIFAPASEVKKRKKGFGPVSAILVTLGIYFGAPVIVLLLMVNYAELRGVDPEKLIDDSIYGRGWFIGLFQMVSALLLWWFVRYRSISAADLGLRRPSVGNLFYAIPVYGLYFLILVSSLAIFKILVPAIDLDQKQQTGLDGAFGFSQLALIFVVLAILTPIAEELIVRGFLYGGLKRKLSKVRAALVASLIFGAAHLQFGSDAPLLWAAAIDTFILSMVLIWLREHTGNIYAGMVVHFIKNTIAYLSIFIFHVS